MNKRIIAVLSYIDVQGKYVVTIHRQKDIHSSIEVNKYSYSFSFLHPFEGFCIAHCIIDRMVSVFRDP